MANMDLLRILLFLFCYYFLPFHVAVAYYRGDMPLVDLKTNNVDLRVFVQLLIKHSLSSYLSIVGFNVCNLFSSFISLLHLVESVWCSYFDLFRIN